MCIPQLSSALAPLYNSVLSAIEISLNTSCYDTNVRLNDTSFCFFFSKINDEFFYTSSCYMF